MENAQGVGIAAPQIGIDAKVFVIDSSELLPKAEKSKAYRGAFINPALLEEYDKEFLYEEGCLSIPGIREKVSRKSKLRIEFLDENLEKQEKEFEGINARIIQHEYDHLHGIMFTDKISVLKKTNDIKETNDDTKKGQ